MCFGLSRKTGAWPRMKRRSRIGVEGVPDGYQQLRSSCCYMVCVLHMETQNMVSGKVVLLRVSRCPLRLSLVACLCYTTAVAGCACVMCVC